MKVRYSYLPQQFTDAEDLWQDLKEFVATGDFTLGAALEKFEREFAELIGARFAIGVNSGTDAIKLSLKALGVGVGDEVITAANTFVATVGAIAELGAIPVFVDCDDTFCLNVDEVERVISEKTKAIVPVHFTGYMTDMKPLCLLGKKYNLPIVEDACQSILGSIDGRNSGTWGETGAFSLHPLKNINVWSDGGVIVTDDEGLSEKLRLLRNHGLSDRDTVAILGCNSRLDTFQAVVGSWLLPKAHEIAEKRITNAARYDQLLTPIQQIRIPPRLTNMKIVFHLYVVFAERRDGLLEFCQEHGVEAKVHYPVPIYRQPALEYLGHKKGDYPRADKHAQHVISFPCDQHLTDGEVVYVAETVKEFYSGIS
jgi:dTDP-3-amino-2,3,6-trideoxy-4-keto-D-glucose/dTDP-3-amino-3,4,6-trideoxy-alpha-D-glucose/dTDP-2,6-dideoxy-D-kanosamine transaminase